MQSETNLPRLAYSMLLTVFFLLVIATFTEARPPARDDIAEAYELTPLADKLPRTIDPRAGQR